jgi:tripartite-type tricarboxylate transporter receptor subunit TctC
MWRHGIFARHLVWCWQSARPWRLRRSGIGTSVRVVVAFAPGGGTDIVARSLSARLAARFGQQFVVDNRPGGGGVTGIELVARAQPDGYTLLVVSSSFAANAALRKTSYDPISGFQPISLLSRQALLVLVHPSVPVNNVKELIALAKAKPGALSYSSSGNGGIQHLATEIFKAWRTSTSCTCRTKGPRQRRPISWLARYR